MCVCVCVCVCVLKRNRLISILKKSVNIEQKKYAREPVILVTMFLHLSVDQGLRTSFETTLRLFDNNIWLSSTNLKDENPMKFRKFFRSQNV